MLETAVRTENDQCLAMVDHQTAARKLQDVLSLRLNAARGAAAPHAARRHQDDHEYIRLSI